MTTLCSQVHSGHFRIKSGEYISFVLQNIKQLTQFSTIGFLVVVKLFMMYKQPAGIFFILILYSSLQAIDLN